MYRALYFIIISECIIIIHERFSQDGPNNAFNGDSNTHRPAFSVGLVDMRIKYIYMIAVLVCIV